MPGHDGTPLSAMAVHMARSARTILYTQGLFPIMRVASQLKINYSNTVNQSCSLSTSRSPSIGGMAGSPEPALQAGCIHNARIGNAVCTTLYQGLLRGKQKSKHHIITTSCGKGQEGASGVVLELKRLRQLCCLHTPGSRQRVCIDLYNTPAASRHA